MERSKKNIIGYIILVIAVGIFAYFAYLDAKPRREAKNTQDTQVVTCGREARQYALDNTKGFENNPYLSDKKQIEKAQSDLYADYLEKCFKKHSLIEEK